MAGIFQGVAHGLSAGLMFGVIGAIARCVRWLIAGLIGAVLVVIGVIGVGLTLAFTEVDPATFSGSPWLFLWGGVLAFGIVMCFIAGGWDS